MNSKFGGGLAETIYIVEGNVQDCLIRPLPNILALIQQALL